MGCMTGFVQIFDRSQSRLYSAKRLPPTSAPVSEKKIGSPAVVVEPDPSPEIQSPGAENPVPGPAAIAPRSPLPLPVFEFKEGTRSSWKFSRESPRLSLDSRATVDAKGSLCPREIVCANHRRAGEDDSENNRRSPSVVARLMGLEPIQGSHSEPPRKPELRRSASESRVSKDLYNHIGFSQLKQSHQTHPNSSSNVIGDLSAFKDHDRASSLRPPIPTAMHVKNTEPANKAHNRGIGTRKSYFDSADFFPEPKQTMSVYDKIEKMLKIRGIDESSKDMETLKQILEALQLKGLLHPRKSFDEFEYRDESPIVLMRPKRTPAPAISPAPASSRSPRPGLRRNVNTPGEASPAVSPRRDRGFRSPNSSVQRQTARAESSVKSPNRRRPLSVETQRRGYDAVSEQRRVSPVNSPKVNSRRSVVSDQRSPRSRKSTVEISRNKEPKVLPPIEDESSSTMSESTSTTTDTERAKMEEHKQGRSLLERCDMLLHSIAEFTSAELQPSPVSVLDSSFDKDESPTSPIWKRSIGFKYQRPELEEEIWESSISSPIESELFRISSEDRDLIYISEILRASNQNPEAYGLFRFLEEEHYLKGNADTSKESSLRRRLVFDVVTEIQSRDWNLPPWKLVEHEGDPSIGLGRDSLRRVWSEFRRIRERDVSEDLFETICGVLRKDLKGDSVRGWGNSPVEVSEAVLDIERLIFKDLIGETIRDLADFSATKCYKPLLSRRKLVF